VIDYDDWPIAYSLKDYLVPGVLVLGLLGATLWAFRRRPCMAFLGAWFFLILAPTSSFLPNVGEVAAERRMYLPVAALITLTVVGAVALGKRLFHERQGSALGYAAFGSVMVLFMFLTIQRNRDYQSVLAIWQDAVVKRPSNPRAHDNLGIILAHLGRVPEAIAHHEQSLRLDPNVAGAHYNLANALWQTGNSEKAIGQYHEALRLNPADIKALTKLGNVLQQMGRTQDAIELYERALRIKPDYAEAHNNLGAALVDRGSIEAGIAQYEQALRINPDFAEAHCNLALALERAGRTREAIGHLEDAVRLKPDLTEARNALARLRGSQ
jgi:tetratricopeptide (TPR) repeat protein